MRYSMHPAGPGRSDAQRVASAIIRQHRPQRWTAGLGTDDGNSAGKYPVLGTYRQRCIVKSCPGKHDLCQTFDSLYVYAPIAQQPADAVQTEMHQQKGTWFNAMRTLPVWEKTKGKEWTREILDSSPGGPT